MEKQYQLTYLFSPELSFDQAQVFCSDIEAIFAKEGKVIKSGKPTRKTLAFPVKQQKSAYLAEIEFATEPSILEALKKELEKKPQILRFLLTSQPKVKTALPQKLKSKIQVPAEQTPEKQKTAPQKADTEKIEEKLEEILDL